MSSLLSSLGVLSSTRCKVADILEDFSLIIKASTHNCSLLWRRDSQRHDGFLQQRALVTGIVVFIALLVVRGETGSLCPVGCAVACPPLEPVSQHSAHPLPACRRCSNELSQFCASSWSRGKFPGAYSA